MGLLNNLKTWYDCTTSGRSEEYKHYKACLEQNKKDIKMWSGFLDTAIQRFKSIEQKFSPDSEEYIKAKSEISRWQETIDGALLSEKFIRPNSQEDIDYRDFQSSNFVQNLQAVLSPNFDLRFHGSPIYYAEQIIKSGQISSTADRYDGYIKSTDRRGEISVSNRESIVDTIAFFSDLNSYYRHSLPAGCIFALMPKDQEDATYGPNLMHSVDFKQNPGQLFGIFTTPENIEQVKEWMNEAELNPDVVYTFEEFLQVVKMRSDRIDEQNQFNSRIEEPNNIGKALVLEDINTGELQHDDKGENQGITSRLDMEK